MSKIDISVFDGMICYPTLLIGLGGTGVQVLRSVKKKLAEQGKEFLTGVEFIYIDHDRNAFAPKAGLPDIEPHEALLLEIDDKMLEDFLKNRKHPDYKSINRRFPENFLKTSIIRKLKLQSGCGQIRALGALSFMWNQAMFKDRVDRAIGNLTSIEAYGEIARKLPNAVIGNYISAYIVGSLAGGTGSGCFLDVAIYLKELVHYPIYLNGLFALPCSGYDVKVDPAGIDSMQRNGYAALKELSFFNIDVENAPVNEILYEYGKTKVVQKQGHSPFSALYFYSTDKDKLKLVDINQLYSTMASSIFLEVGTPLGADMLSVTANLAHVQKLERFVNSTSAITLKLNQDEYLNYFTYRMCSVILSKITVETADYKSDVDSFLGTGLGIEERSGQDQLINQLKNSHLKRINKYKISSGNSKFIKLAPDKFKILFDEETENQRGNLVALEKIISSYSQRLFNDGIVEKDDNKVISFRERVLNKTVAYYDENGIGAAKSFLSELRSAVKAIYNELEAENRKWIEDRKVSVEEISSNFDKLNKMGPFHRSVSKKDEKFKEEILDLAQDIYQHDVDTIIKTNGLRICDNIVELCRIYIDSFTALEKIISTLKENYSALYNGIEAKIRPSLFSSGDVTFNVIDLLEINYKLEFKDWYQKEEIDKALMNISSNDALKYLLGKDSSSTTIIDKDDVTVDRIEKQFTEAIFSKFVSELKSASLIEYIIKHDPKFLSINVALTTNEPALNLLPKFDEPLINIMAVKRFKGKLDDLFVDLLKNNSNKFTARTPILTTHADPMEMIITRRVYGGILEKIVPLNDFKITYDTCLEEEDQKPFTHVELIDIPDLFKLDRTGIQEFAIACALGFIVKRRSSYYRGIKQKGLKYPYGFHDDDKIEYRVDFSSQWDTVFKSSKSKLLDKPGKLGDIGYVWNSGTINKEYLLASGRDKAFQEFISDKNEDFLALVKGAIASFEVSVTQENLRSIFIKYHEWLIGLTPAIESLHNLYLEEANALDDYMKSKGF